MSSIAALMVAAVLFIALSFFSILAVWKFTVRSEIPMILLLSPEVLPSAVQRSTSISRAVKCVTASGKYFSIRKCDNPWYAKSTNHDSFKDMLRNSLLEICSSE